MASKAQEYVTMAAITEVPSEKRNLLRESLKVHMHFKNFTCLVKI